MFKNGHDLNQVNALSIIPKESDPEYGMKVGKWTANLDRGMVVRWQHGRKMERGSG